MTLKKRVFFLLNFCAAVCEYFRKISTAEKSPLSPITSTFVKIYSISLKSGTLPSGGFFPIFFPTFLYFHFQFSQNVKHWPNLWKFIQFCSNAASCDLRGFYARCGTFFKQALHIFSSFQGFDLDDITYRMTVHRAQSFNPWQEMFENWTSSDTGRTDYVRTGGDRI